MKQCYVNMGCVPISRIIMTSNNSINLFCHLWCPNLSPTRESWAQTCIQNQRLKHVKQLVYPLGYILLYSLWPMFENIFRQLYLVYNIVTLFPHVFSYNIGWVLGLRDVCDFDCIQDCIQDECFIYPYYVISNKPKSPTIYFTIFTW